MTPASTEQGFRDRCSGAIRAAVVEVCSPFEGGRWLTPQERGLDRERKRARATIVVADNGVFVHAKLDK
jgi:hypothetical protein